ncbi:MAG TPA: phenylalanine--tRNA ligase beta subunit-related protein [Methylomirabilota bacterium]|jgi:DNA/RNA-binding domain of Phe-tRNA-synthetase-like protein
MYFCHADAIWADYPELVPAVVHARGITSKPAAGPRLTTYYEIAESRLATTSEGELVPIQAWRRVFSRMGLKPTQYRSAAESLLRRFRKEKSLPQIHPLIDVCNAISVAYAIPIAVFDVSKIADYVEVRYATGAETYLSFSGETENPEPGEVIFADSAGRAHARRWTNRQSRYSAIDDGTMAALIVAEGVHGSANEDLAKVGAAIAGELNALWSVPAAARVLTRSSARFEF